MRMFVAFLLSAVLWLIPEQAASAPPAEIDRLVKAMCDQDRTIEHFGDQSHETCRMTFVCDDRFFDVYFLAEKLSPRTIWVRRDGLPTRVVDIERSLTFTVVGLRQFREKHSKPREEYMTFNAPPGMAFDGQVSLGMIGPAFRGYLDMIDRFNADEREGEEHRARWQARIDSIFTEVLRYAEGGACVLPVSH